MILEFIVGLFVGLLVLLFVPLMIGFILNHLWLDWADVCSVGNSFMDYLLSGIISCLVIFGAFVLGMVVVVAAANLGHWLIGLV